MCCITRCENRFLWEDIYFSKIHTKTYWCTVSQDTFDMHVNKTNSLWISSSIYLTQLRFTVYFNPYEFWWRIRTSFIHVARSNSSQSRGLWVWRVWLEFQLSHVGHVWPNSLCTRISTPTYQAPYCVLQCLLI